MQNLRMSLEAFKANAENKNVEIALDNIQGGSLFNCHGKWGQVGKAVGDWVNDRVDSALDRVVDNLMNP